MSAEKETKATEPTTPARFRRETIATIVVAVLAVVVACGAVYYYFVAPSALDIPNRELSDREVFELVRDLRRAYWTEDAAEQFALKYGHGSKSFIIGFINSRGASPTYKGQLCSLLGKFRDAESGATVVQYVNNGLKGSFTRDDISGLAGALDGLGYLATDEAIDLLEAMAAIEYWKTISTDKFVPEENRTFDDIIRLLRGRAIRALGIAPEGQGIASLKRLRSGPASDLSNACDEALDDARARKWGWDHVGTLLTQ